MKQTRRCPKCNNAKIGYLESLLDQAGMINVGRQSVGIDAETYEVEGELEAYICSTCGYLETYLKRPQEVPLERLKGFRWLEQGRPQEGPYR